MHIPFCHISLPITNIHFFLFDIKKTCFAIIIEIVLLPFVVLLSLQEKRALPMAIFAITHGITTGKCTLPTEYPRPRVVGKSLVGN
jgi:hypothetical protein